MYRYAENQHNMQESRKAGKEISIQKEKAGRETGKIDQSGTRQEGKKGSGLYQTGNEQEKQGKYTACSKKSWYISNRQESRKETQADDHIVIWPQKKIILPLYQDDLYQDYFHTVSIGFIRLSGIHTCFVCLARFPIFFRFRFRSLLARSVLYRSAIRQSYVARKYRSPD